MTKQTTSTLKPRRKWPLRVWVDMPQVSFAESASTWKGLPLPAQTGYNLLAAKMQQAGLFPAGPRQSGYTLFMQMSRAARSIGANNDWTRVPQVPAPPPAPPPFTLTATDNGGQTTVYLSAAAFPVGCQVWVSEVFAPGGRDPLSQRLKLVGALTQGWPEGGLDITASLGKWFRAPVGGAFVVKIVPVSPGGFTGPSLSEMGLVTEPKPPSAHLEPPLPASENPPPRCAGFPPEEGTRSEYPSPHFIHLSPSGGNLCEAQGGGFSHAPANNSP